MKTAEIVPIRSVLALALVVFVGLSAVADLPAGTLDVSGVVEHGQTPVEGSWFLELAPGLAPSVAHGVERAVLDRGARIHFRYRLLPLTWNVRGLDDEGARALASLPGVHRVSPDYRVRGGMAESAPLIGATPAQKSGAGFSGVDGSGVRVCIADSGIRHSHIVFEGRTDVAADRDFINGDNDAADDNGHGTHVAATAAGGDGFIIGNDPWQGIAHEATLVAVKVLDAGGGGTASTVIAGIDYCADSGSGGGRADVINLSLGGGLFSQTCDGDPIAQAANNAVDAGVVVVAAAGNDCHDIAVNSPACGSKVMAVGATWDSSGSRSPRFGCFRGTCQDRNYQADDSVCFSNRSGLVSVTAPGAATTSAAHNSDDGVATFYGTSQATPHVAGLAALLLDQDSTRGPLEVRRLIEDGAVDLGEAGFDSSYGHGRIDVLASLEGSPCGDGVCDTPSESACSCPVDCGTPPSSETSCSDGVDNDCDGAIDCTDGLDCLGDPACPCGNGICDAGESVCTCEVDCGEPPATEEACDDGVDNDCDGSVDGEDTDCTGGAVCGDKVCDGGSEDCVSCPEDCRAAKGGVDCCGDGLCTGTEKFRNCPVDCL